MGFTPTEKMEVRLVKDGSPEIFIVYDRPTNKVKGNQRNLGFSSNESPDICQKVNGRSTESILKVIRKNTPTENIKVYRTFLQRYSNLEGKVTVKFAISSEGKVIKIMPISDSSKNPKFVNAIISTVEKWQFSKSGCEKPDIVTVPFTFSK